MASATANGNTFLTDDPLWAQDFAPNGKQTLIGDMAIWRLTNNRQAPGTRRDHHQEALCQVRLNVEPELETVPITNTLLSTLEKIAYQGIDVFYKGELGKLVLAMHHV